MYCENCGQQLSKEAVFCSICGEACKEDKREAATKPITRSQCGSTLATAAENLFKAALRALPLIGIIAAVVLIVGGGIIALVSGLNQGSTAYQEGKQYIEDFAEANKDHAENFDKSTNHYKGVGNEDNELLNIIILFGLLILIIGLLVIYYYRARKKALYTPTDCSICNKPTGIKGNKRFKFIDGFVCENCLKEAYKKTESTEAWTYYLNKESTLAVKNELLKKEECQ